ncbi:MAG: hypothetical protein KGM98_03780 [Bacteroidota bacterium]|nr:hypothetical protein [Bacteroidota bacterium]
MVVYDKRAGSNEDLMNLILLCTNAGRIYQAFHGQYFSRIYANDHFNSGSESWNSSNRNEFYKLAIILSGNDQNNYKLSVNIYDRKSLDKNSKSRYSNKEHVILHFDKNHKIFSNGTKQLKGNYSVFDPRLGKEVKRYYSITCPIIILGTYTYCYIEGEWYVISNDDKLYKYTYCSLPQKNDVN